MAFFLRLVQLVRKKRDCLSAVTFLSDSEKIHFCYTAGNTGFRAIAAAGTFTVIDLRTVVDHANSIVFTNFFAFFTADAAPTAGFSGVGAFVVAGTADDHPDRSGNDPDLPAGADLGTKAAAYAQVRSDTGNAVFDADGTVGTNLGAVADPKTALGTHGIACVVTVGSHTGVDAAVIVFSGHRRVFTAAGNVSDLGNNDLFFPLHDCGKPIANLRAAGHTQSGGMYFAVCQCVGVAVTTGKAAGAAVGAGQTLADLQKVFILRDGHKF